MDRISYFGILGYGVDVLHDEPTQSLVDFSYQRNDNAFKWNGKTLLIPDQITFDPSPKGRWAESSFTSKITTAREYQIKMANKVGLSVTDPETDMTFKGDASFANKLFSQTDSERATEFYETDNDFVFLSFTKINLRDALKQEARDAIAYCGTDANRIMGFYDAFGTHVVRKADVGGRMHIRTVVSLDKDSSKKIHEMKINISGQVEVEDGDYAKQDLDFKSRDKNTSELYRQVSRKDIELVGGDNTSLNEKAWRATLRDSEIPTQALSPLSAARGRGVAAHLEADVRNQNLGLINQKYSPMHEALGLQGKEKDAFQTALRQYLNGVNPFADKPQRLKPKIELDSPIKKGEKATHEMRGWMATYETYAGLEAKPGAWALVECKSDAEPGGWDEKTVYAGEKIQLRGKTPYMSKYMYVKVKQIEGDDGATVYSENKLVSW